MNCPRCGAASDVLHTRASANVTTRRRRQCHNGHRFTTLEVPSQVYGTVRQRLATFSKTTAERVARWNRDRAIAHDLHQGWRTLAARYGLTKTAIYLAARRGRDGNQPKART